MTESLQDLLLELEQFGLNNDGAIADRPRRMLNITRDTGEFLSLLVRAMNARRVLEIGTSNGYPTLWLASAAKAVQGKVTTVELSDFKISLAAQNFERSGLAPFIMQIHGDACALLAASPESGFDLLFLDSERSEYLGWWPDIKRVLRKGGLLVVDNATSHAVETAPFAAVVSADREPWISRSRLRSSGVTAVRREQFLRRAAASGSDAGRVVSAIRRHSG